MSEALGLQVAIVDYEMGNLFSVKQACEHVGMNGVIATTREELANADAVILPGVGAFGDAMESLVRLDLVGPLREIGASDKPLIGICLGMQLLMTESYEFGRHPGLGLIPGPVVRLENLKGIPPASQVRRNTALKVPQVGWNRIFKAGCPGATTQPVNGGEDPWAESCLAGLEDGEYMYFVHSFYAKPENRGVVLATSSYGDVDFCSSLIHRNIFACQFHPERSGRQGLRIYGNIASLLKKAASTEDS